MSIKDDPNPVDYSTIETEMANNPKREYHLLLGNGFSIGCNEIYSYRNLFENAVKVFPAETIQIFRALGTENFEGVMRTLYSTEKIASIFGDLPLIQQCDTHAKIIKEALIRMIVETHLSHPDQIPDEMKRSCRLFLSPFQKIFTTNFDLNLYWITMSETSKPRYIDGFGADPKDPDAKYLAFNGLNGRYPSLNFLHGAIHLFQEDGMTKKHSWARTGKRLIELIREALREQRYPMFVGGGTAAQKREQINSYAYLGLVFQRFKQIKSPLIILGHSLSESDSHIGEAIGINIELEKVFVGLHGDPKNKINQAIRSKMIEIQSLRQDYILYLKKGKPLEVVFFKSETARVWNRSITVDGPFLVQQGSAA